MHPVKEKIWSLHGFGPVLINLFRKLLNTKHDLINFSCHELSFLDWFFLSWILLNISAQHLIGIYNNWVLEEIFLPLVRILYNCNYLIKISVTIWCLNFWTIYNFILASIDQCLWMESIKIRDVQMTTTMFLYQISSKDILTISFS